MTPLLLNGKRVCYYIDESMRRADGSYYPVIVTEGEPGYNATDWDYGKDFKKAKAAVDVLNARNYTTDDVADIVTSSMFPNRR